MVGSALPPLKILCGYTCEVQGCERRAVGLMRLSPTCFLSELDLKGTVRKRVGGPQGLDAPILTLPSDGLSLGRFLFLLSQESSQSDWSLAGGEGTPDPPTLTLTHAIL